MSQTLPIKLSDGKAVNSTIRPKTAPARVPKATPHDIPIDRPLTYKVKVIRDGESSSIGSSSHHALVSQHQKNKIPLDYTKPPVHHDSWR